MPVINADTLGPYRKPWLLPVLLAQGKLVKLRAMRLPEASGPRSGRVDGAGTEFSLVVIGDSAAAGVGVSRQEQALAPALARELHRLSGRPVCWRVIARSGIGAVGALTELLPEALRHDEAPDLMVTSLGVNDVMGLTPSPAFLDAMQGLVGAMRDRHGPGLGVVLGRVPPLDASPLFRNPLRGLVAWRIGRINALLADVADSHPDVILASEPSVLDPAALAADGFHPNAESYPEWAEHLAQCALRTGCLGETAAGGEPVR